MSTRVGDLNLIFKSKGKTAYYATVKGGDEILLELKCGIYSGKTPDIFKILNFTKNTEWADCFEPLDEALSSEEAVYGTTEVDFDNKTITSDNGYAHFYQLHTQWVIADLNAALDENEESQLLSKKTILDHIKNQRLVCIYISEEGHEVREVLPSDPQEVLDRLQINPNFQYMSQIEVMLPEDWEYIPHS